jgi:DNA-binding MarR family transcriptional regulator
MIKNTWQKIARYYNRRLSAYGLSVPQALLLLELSLTAGVNPHFLSERLTLDSSSMTGLLSRMETAGLLERRADHDDRRKVQVFLTSKGAVLQKTIFSLVSEIDDRLSTKIPAEETAIFRRVTSTIARELGNE